VQFHKQAEARGSGAQGVLVVLSTSDLVIPFFMECFYWDFDLIHSPIGGKKKTGNISG